MKTLACSDLIPDCTATFEGDTEEEVLAQAARHAAEAHNLDVTPELVQRVRACIRDSGGAATVTQ